MDTTYHIHNSFLCLSTSAVANHHPPASYPFIHYAYSFSLAGSVRPLSLTGLTLGCCSFFRWLAGVRSAAAAGRQDILLLNIELGTATGSVVVCGTRSRRRGREDVAAVNKLLFRDVVQSTLTVRRQRFVCNGTKYTNSI